VCGVDWIVSISNCRDILEAVITSHNYCSTIMTVYRRFITLLLIAIGSSSCSGRRGFNSIAIINRKNEKTKIGYPDYTTTSLPLKAKQTYKYKSNLLSTQSIINCNVQTKDDRQCSTEDDTLFGNTNKEQSKHLIERSSRRQQQDRSDILYTIRGGSSYNGDDDYNDCKLIVVYTFIALLYCSSYPYT